MCTGIHGKLGLFGEADRRVVVCVCCVRLKAQEEEARYKEAIRIEQVGHYLQSTIHMA